MSAFADRNGIKWMMGILMEERQPWGNNDENPLNCTTLQTAIIRKQFNTGFFFFLIILSKNDHFQILHVLKWTKTATCSTSVKNNYQKATYSPIKDLFGDFSEKSLARGSHRWWRRREQRLSGCLSMETPCSAHPARCHDSPEAGPVWSSILNTHWPRHMMQHAAATRT